MTVVKHYSAEQPAAATKVDCMDTLTSRLCILAFLRALSGRAAGRECRLTKHAKRRAAAEKQTYSAESDLTHVFSLAHLPGLIVLLIAFRRRQVCRGAFRRGNSRCLVAHLLHVGTRTEFAGWLAANPLADEAVFKRVVVGWDRATPERLQAGDRYADFWGPAIDVNYSLDANTVTRVLLRAIKTRFKAISAENEAVAIATCKGNSTHTCISRSVS